MLKTQEDINQLSYKALSKKREEKKLILLRSQQNLFFFFLEKQTQTHTHKREGTGVLTQRHTTTLLKSHGNF